MNDLEIIAGEASDSLARIYVRMLRPAGSNATLTGKVTGPYSERARTLPADFLLRDLGSSELLVAEALITEPCFWLPDEPYLYRVSVEVRDGTQVLESHEEMWALRRPNKTNA